MESELWQYLTTGDFGFPLVLGEIKFHISIWTLLLGILLLTDSLKYIKRFYPKSTTAWYLLCSFGAVVMVATSIALHEISHGLVTHLLGFQITDAGTTALGAYVKPSVSFLEMAGWQTMLISIAGPAMNALIALGIMALNGRFQESLGENLLQYVGVINWRLWLLNMFPLFPLDGGRAVFGFMKLFFTSNTHAFVGAVVVTVLAIVWLIKRERPNRWYETQVELPKPSRHRPSLEIF